MSPIENEKFHAIIFAENKNRRANIAVKSILFQLVLMIIAICAIVKDNIVFYFTIKNVTVK